MNNLKITKEKKDDRIINKNSTNIHINITRNFLDQIKYLTKNIDDSLEWSGVMFYETKGEVSNLQKFEITPTYIYLMDIGGGATTDFDYTTELTEFKMNNPQFIGKTFGKIHSHNKMNAFMSETDISDLHDNSKMYNMYLSIVTNNNLDFNGGIDINYKLIDKSMKYSFINSLGKEIIKKFSKKNVKYVEHHELDFYIEEDKVTVTEDFKKRVVEVKKKKENEIKNAYVTQGSMNFGYNPYDNNHNSNNYGINDNHSVYHTDIYSNNVIDYEDNDILNIMYYSLFGSEFTFFGDVDRKTSIIYKAVMDKVTECRTIKELDKFSKEIKENINKNIRIYLEKKGKANIDNQTILIERFNFYLSETFDELQAVLQDQGEVELASKIEQFSEIFN